jgi:glycosyltransferase involved in cell wall biosynthesis
LENKIIELPSGVHKEWLKEEDNLKDDKIRFLFIGRNERRKGVKELFSLFQMLNHLKN